MRGPILGWDVGGANLKVARISADGRSEPQVLERPLALWRDPGSLAAVLAEMSEQLGGARTMAVTMTAELADCFASKREGVGFVLDAFRTTFPDAEQWVYGVDGTFRSPETARRHADRVAAANWMASATFAARRFPDALFVDVGSTTTDVIPIVAGHVAARGQTDLGRLQSGELVYTGALRTPVCAIVRSVPLRGRRYRVAAEVFAVAADVHLWLGHIAEGDYTCETPDGRGRSRHDAGARLARMVCADFEALASPDITAIAKSIACAQVRQIASGIRQVKRRLGSACPHLAVLAGQGAFLARLASKEAGFETHDLAADVGRYPSRALPAAAVAYLLAGTCPNAGRPTGS